MHMKCYSCFVLLILSLSLPLAALSRETVTTSDEGAAADGSARPRAGQDRPADADILLSAALFNIDIEAGHFRETFVRMGFGFGFRI